MKNSPFLALKFKNYRWFWFGSLFSQIGDQMQNVAVAWLLYQLTHSPVALGFIGVADFIPTVLFSLFGGVTADRFNRKTILIVSQIILAFFAFILALLSLTNNLTPVWIYISLALAAIVRSFTQPTRQSIIPHLVPKEYLINAISLNTLLRQGSLIVGPAIAGGLIAFWGVQSVFLFNVVSFIVLVFALLPLRIPAHELGMRASYSFRSIIEGIKFVKNTPIMYSTMILDAFATFFGAATVLMPIFAEEVLKVGPQGLGLLYAAPSVGGVLAGLVISSQTHLKHYGRVIIISLIIYSIATIGFGLSKSLYLSLFFLSLVGIGDMVSTIARNTLRQLITPDHMRGRMVSINVIFAQGGPKLGEAEGGFMAALVGAPASVVIGGVASLIVTILIALKAKKLRDFKSSDI